MRSYYRNFYRLLFCTALCFGTASIGLCQSPGGWSLEAPPNSVKLVSVGQGMSLGALKFTFENVSGKTIVVFFVGNLHGSEVGLDGFIAGMGAVTPGATTSLEFGSQDFSAGGQITKKLRVNAIFYDDGSGFRPDKAQIEDEMLGAALETKRDAELLSASPDPSISGLDKVVARVLTKPLNTPAEAVQSLQGITLAGISQAFIDKHLADQSLFIKIGAYRARGEILIRVAAAKSNDARAMAGPEIARQRELAIRSHALSDLARKASLRSEWQAQYLEKVYQRKE
jgi:hypothetical protein